MLLVLAVAAACATPPATDPARTPSPATVAGSPLAAEICNLLAAPSPALTAGAMGTLPALREIYRPRKCEPLWHGGTALSRNGRQLLDRLRKVGAADPTTISANRAELDLLMSAGFAALAVDPADPALTPTTSRLVTLATQAAIDPSQLRVALPADPQIRRLRDAIESYRQIERSGGWPRVPEGTKLALGDRGAQVAALRDRLSASGDMQAVAGDPAYFDAALASGLRRFQARHGLLVDGVAAKDSFAALNVPVASRRAALAAKLRELSRQQRDWGARYIAVNIAAETMTLVEDGRLAVARRVIVGRPGWQTPELDSVIERLEFHPYWTVPAGIARLELLPKIRKDRDYLRRNNMSMVSGQIRQAPGPGNPLGRVKFLFANPHSVYLHDTSAPELFARPERFLSHGCVRVEQAVDLARRLLRDDPAWPQPRIDAALAAGRNVRVDLARPIPLHLVYDTAWVDDDGTVNFRNDAYGRDSTIAALRTASAVHPGNNCGA